MAMRELKNLIDSGVLRYVVFDFDDTLFAWSDTDSFNEYEFAMSAIKGNNFYKDHPSIIKPIDFMVDFCRKLRKDFTIEGLYCVTVNSSSAPYNAKKQMLDEVYTDLIDGLYIVPSQEERIRFIGMLAEVYGASSKRVLVVDDRPDVRDMANEYGFYSTSPIAIYSTFYCKE